jgi:CRISPR/Cas system-associated protein endoribonuclease Cas2
MRYSRKGGKFIATYSKEDLLGRSISMFELPTSVIEKRKRFIKLGEHLNEDGSFV